MISVIIATKNGEKYIARAINSVLVQTYAKSLENNDKLELIVVNDGSTDTTASIVENLSHSDVRIKLISLEKNIGPGLARNEGIKIAQGDYIAFIDDDDEWISKEKLSLQATFLDSHLDYALVGATHINLVYENSTKKSIHINPSTDTNIRLCMLRRNCFANSSVLIRKSALENVGYFKPLYLSEDYDLWLRLGMQYKLANLHGCDIAYMIRPGNASISRKLELYKGIVAIIQTYKDAYPGYTLALCKAYGRILIGTIQNLF